MDLFFSKKQCYICRSFLSNCEKFGGSSFVQAEGRCEIPQAWIFSPPPLNPPWLCALLLLSQRLLAPLLCCWPPTDSCSPTFDLLSVQLTLALRCPCRLCCRERAKRTFYQHFFAWGLSVHLCWTCGTLTTVTFG